MNRARLWTIVRVALSVGLLALLFRKGVDVTGLVTTLRQAHPLPLLGAVGLYCVAGSIVRGYRWRALITSLGHRISLARSTELFLVGTFFNQIMPTAIGGDVVRAVMLARDGVGRAHAASTVLVDRALGVMTLLVPGLIALLLAPGRASPTVTALLAMAGLAGLAGGVFAINGRSWRPHAMRIPVVGKLFARQGIGRFVDSFAEYGLPALGRAAGWSLAFTLVLIGTNVLLGRALGITTVSVVDWATLVPLIAIAMLVPLIGGWGIREWSYVGLLGLLTPPIARTPAAAMGLLLGFLNTLLALVGWMLSARGAVGTNGGVAAETMDAKTGHTLVPPDPEPPRRSWWPKAAIAALVVGLGLLGVSQIPGVIRKTPPPAQVNASPPSRPAAVPAPSIAPSAAARLRLVGHSGGQVRAAVADGSELYLGAGPRLLRIGPEPMTRNGKPGTTMSVVAESELLAGDVRGLAVQAGLAYAAVSTGGQTGGLQIIRLSTDFNLGHTYLPSVGFMPLTGTLQAVAVDGEKVLVAAEGPTEVSDGGLVAKGNVRTNEDVDVLLADHFGTVYIVDASDPARPELKGRIDAGHPFTGIALHDGYAYLSVEDYQNLPGLTVYDIHHAGAPKMVGRLYTEDITETLSDIVIRGNRLYAQNWSGYRTGLLIVDIADPANPRRLGFLDNPIGLNASLEGVVVDDRYAYTLQGYNEWHDRYMQVVDIADPANPIEVGHYDADTHGTLLAADGGYAYAVQPSGTFEAVDLSDPKEPRPKDNMVPTFSDLDYTMGLATVGDQLFQATEGNLSIISTTQLSRSFPTWPSDLPADSPDSAGDANLWVRGIGSFNFHDSSTPAAVPIGVAADADRALLLWERNGIDGRRGEWRHELGLTRLDVRDPAKPRGTGMLDVVDNADFERFGAHAAVTGDRAFIVVRDGLPRESLHVIDLGAPLAPKEIGVLVGDSIGLKRTSGVAAQGGYAYVADRSAGVHVIDVSRPGRLQEVALANTPPDAAAIAVGGAHAYVVDGHSGALDILDISDPTSPQEIATAPAPAGSGSSRWPAEASFVVTVRDKLVFVAGHGQVWQVDVSDPEHPTRMILRSGIGGQVSSLAVAASHVFLSTVGDDPDSDPLYSRQLWVFER